MLRRIESWPDWKIAATTALVLRIFYSAAAATLSYLIHPDPALVGSNALTENLPTPGSLHYALLGIWERFDTLWYLRIADRGYDMPAAVVFHPLYPALIRALMPVTGGITASLLVSTIAAAFLFAGMIRLARLEFSAEERLRPVILLAVWPTSFIFFAGYTDSLAAALVVWCIVFARSKRWIPASGLACAAGLTRSMGVLLVVPLAAMAWRERRSNTWPVLLAPSGSLGYWAWLHFTGRPTIVDAYRQFWNTQVAAPWTTLWHAVSQLFRRPDTLLAFSLVVLALFAWAGTVARRSIEDRVFTAAVVTHILLRLCTPPLLGVERYLLPAYPAFLTMAAALQKMRGNRFAFLCCGLLALNLAWMYAFLNWSLVL